MTHWTALVTAVLLIAWLLIACVVAWLDDRRRTR